MGCRSCDFDDVAFRFCSKFDDHHHEPNGDHHHFRAFLQYVARPGRHAEFWSCDLFRFWRVHVHSCDEPSAGGRCPHSTSLSTFVCRFLFHGYGNADRVVFDPPVRHRVRHDITRRGRTGRIVFDHWLFVLPWRRGRRRQDPWRAVLWRRIPAPDRGLLSDLLLVGCLCWPHVFVHPNAHGADGQCRPRQSRTRGVFRIFGTVGPVFFVLCRGLFRRCRRRVVCDQL